MPLPTPPTVPDARELYDTLMGNIEPELTHAQLPTLEEKYKDETEEQKTQRVARYNAAFAKFAQALKAYKEQLDKSVADYRRTAFAFAEEEVRTEEERQLSDLEQAISS